MHCSVVLWVTRRLCQTDIPAVTLWDVRIGGEGSGQGWLGLCKAFVQWKVKIGIGYLLDGRQPFTLPVHCVQRLDVHLNNICKKKRKKLNHKVKLICMWCFYEDPIPGIMVWRAFRCSLVTPLSLHTLSTKRLMKRTTELATSELSASSKPLSVS